MTKIAFGLILASLQVLSGTGAQEPKPVLQLTLSPYRIETASGHEFRLFLHVVNLSKRTVNCDHIVNIEDLDVAYIYDIRGSDGKPIPRTHPDADNSQVGACRLIPGGEFDTEIFCLMSCFDMSKPGVYTVQVSRRDFARPNYILGTSNKVTVIVKAPE